ncbi:MAG: hypothetical protein DMG08_15025 [Acidobacteria bacterium]|nr:MAG: hypothetical protein DMG08_15025 [Acidobacteriota bacterium]
MLRAFAVKVQPRIHREAAKSAKISRRKILPCQRRIFGLVIRSSLAATKHIHRRVAGNADKGFANEPMSE